MKKTLQVVSGCGALLLWFGMWTYPLIGADSTVDQATWNTSHPKEIYAHYMGCYPVGIGSVAAPFLRKTEATVHPNDPSYLAEVGGRWRDFPLMPADYKPTLEESVDLEMRRAMRMGLDGFAIDILAGQQIALDTMDAMFKVAEAKHYPFKITFCLDNPKQSGEAIKRLVEVHGQSPNLARRDGKPLILAYRTCALQARLHPGLSDPERISPEGIEIYNQAAQELETTAGQPLYLMFCLNGFVPGEDTPDTGLSADPAFWKSAVAILGKKFSGLSAFFWGGTNFNLAAQAAHAANLDWGEPIWYQYQNLYWGTLRVADGTDLLRDRWDHAIANQATLLQEATWNDYTEATAFAPTRQTGYAINDLTSLFIQKWKTGKMPEAKTDRIYAFYPPYAKGSPVYPFHETSPELSQQLEITTFLTSPATVTMPGRLSDTRPDHDMSWQAPVGLFVQKLPSTPGPVIVEISRGGKKVLTLTGRDPITDHPFRPDHTMVGVCTEDDRLWKEDFPGIQEPFPPGYYADSDYDGLPNWFEMYWFGQLGDFSTSTLTKSGDNPASDSSTNLQKFLSRSNPLAADKSPTVGTEWTLMQNPVGGSFNPETDAENRPCWRYFSGNGSGQWTAYESMHYGEEKDGRVTIAHNHDTPNRLNPPPPMDKTAITYHWEKTEGQGDGFSRWLSLMPLPEHPVKIEWTCPTDGTYHVDLTTQLDTPAIANHASAQLKLIGTGIEPVWSASLQTDHPTGSASVDLHLRRGETLSLEAETPKALAGQLQLTRLNIGLAALP